MTDDKKIETSEILAWLYKHHDEERYVCADEVGDRPCGATRRMDFVACDCWWSGGFKIAAYEIKISKADLRHDLEDPTKHNIFFDSIDTFTIVAPDYVLDAEYKSMIPPKWGIISLRRGKDKDGKDTLVKKTIRKPLALNDDTERQKTFNREFAATILRRCAGKLQSRHQLDVAEAYKKGYTEGMYEQNGVNYMQKYEEEVARNRWLREFVYDCGLSAYDKDECKKVVEFIRSARDLMSDAKYVSYVFDNMTNKITEMKDAYKIFMKTLMREDAK